jgi:trk system potassium uptake protein
VAPPIDPSRGTAPGRWREHLRAVGSALDALDPAASKGARLPWTSALAALVVALVVGVVELFFIAGDHPLLSLVVLLGHASLVLGFLGWLARAIAHAGEERLSLLAQRRVDVVVGLVGAGLLAVAPRVAGGIIIARLLSMALGVALTTPLGIRVARLANLRPPQTLALSFLVVISAGTALLATPAATATGVSMGLVDALFTMTSATTVTGLVVVDTGSFLSPFGKAIILLGMQIGAVSTLVLGAAFIVVVGGRLPGQQQQELSQLLQVNPGEGLRRLVAAVSATTLVAEGLGVTSLYLLWLSGWIELPAAYDDPLLALWWCVFHAVSAFCNAGFALSPDSLSAFVGDPLVCFVFAALITTGGLGFAVMSDLARRLPWLERPRWSWDRLQIQTRVVLLAMVALNLVGALLILFLEYEGALAPYNLPTKLLAAVFQAVSLRTAGFNSIPMAGLAIPTLIVMLVWMFVGAGPGSTGGGVKTTTALTVVLAVRAMLRGRDDVELFGRTLPQSIVYRSIAIVLVTGLVAERRRDGAARRHGEAVDLRPHVLRAGGAAHHGPRRGRAGGGAHLPLPRGPHARGLVLSPRSLLPPRCASKPRES